MKDFTDGDEKVLPLRPGRVGSSRMLDRVLTLAGLAMAGAAAVFPWYVFFNEDKFVIRVAEMERARVLPDWPSRPVVQVSPAAIPNRTPRETQQVLPLDPMATATISDLGRIRREGPPAEDQPFPGRAGFRLLHVSNGRAMIADEGGMYMVSIGSVLPDESRLAKIEQQNGRWVIVTSSGKTFETN